MAGTLSGIAPSTPVDAGVGRRGTSRWAAFALDLATRRAAVVGLALYLIIVFFALAANVVTPYPPNQIDMSGALQLPSAAHLLGTDELGRDILTRVVYGARVSVMVGVISISIAVVIGVPLGLISGFYGHSADLLISRLADSLLAFPSIVLALAIISVLGPNLQNAMVAIGIVYVPVFIRLIRGGVLATRVNEYVLAARVAGANDAYLMFRTVLPNIMSPLLVQITLGFADAIIAEAALSFLGIGVQPPTPSWGAMLDTGRRYLSQTLWYTSSAGIAIFVTVLSLNLFGDGLRDVLDPRLRQR